MFRCFTAYKRATRQNTAVCNAFNDLCNLFRNILTDCDIVKEEQRLCTRTSNVVYTHCNAVLTDSIVLVHKESNSDFCTYTVSTRNKYRIFVVFRHFKKSAEAADSAKYALNRCLFNVVLD